MHELLPNQAPKGDAMKELLSASIVVPVLNGASSIHEMLTSLLDQTKGLESEVLIVDGGSTDRTREIVKGFDVTLLEETEPGPAAARNLGLSKATGDIIITLSADTIPAPRWFSELIAPFAHPHVMLVSGRCLPIPPETKTIAELYVAARSVQRKRALSKIIPYVPSMNMAVRRKCAVAIGGWSQEMITGEDIDFCYRLLTRFRAQIMFAPRSIVFHRRRMASDEDLRQRAWSHGEGLAHLFLRHPDLFRSMILNSIKLIGNAPYRSSAQLNGTHGLFGLTQAQFAYYQRLWTWWYWRGFLDMYKNRAYRRVPGPPSI